MGKKKKKRRRGPSGPVQAVFFSSVKFTDSQARAWLKDHDYSPLKGTRKRTLTFEKTGALAWIGWEVSPIPRNKDLRWIPFGPNIRARILVPKGKGNPKATARTDVSTSTRNPRRKVRTGKGTQTRNPTDALLRACRARAEFLSNGIKAEDIPIDSIRIRSTTIPLQGLFFLGPFRQLNYTAPKFNGKWKEFWHRPDGFPRVGAKLMSKDGGLTFMHPDGDWILIVPGKNQRGRFRVDARGVLN